ncbi:arginase family protein [Lysinibacillus louembei]|uniref:Arginase family protein n=1 Tax=Lysinibacillus louembei TaxID=1470088 RepID=A0ABZ0RWR2_9BACI|nr:arginase family protein [Lysinibacillus louembei]WPK12669.1 arginase family protein [Lysinibacillus louembei]
MKLTSPAFYLSDNVSVTHDHNQITFIDFSRGISDEYTVADNFDFSIFETGISEYQINNSPEMLSMLKKGYFVSLLDLYQKYREKLNNRSFFGFPFLSIGEVINRDNITVSILGVCYDLGASYKKNQQFTPYILRETSQSNISKQFGNNMIADCGDITSDTVMKQNGEKIQQLQTICSLLSKYKKKPLIIGGDHSISFYSISGLLDSYNKITILHIDAHFDGVGYFENDIENLDHSNFINYLLFDERVEEIIHIGNRQMGYTPQESKKRRFVSLEQFLTEAPKKDAIYYLTFDVDWIDPTIISSVGTPVAFGATLKDVASLISHLKEYNLIGADIVEFIGSFEKNSENITINSIIQQILNLLR